MGQFSNTFLNNSQGEAAAGSKSGSFASTFLKAPAQQESSPSGSGAFAKTFNVAPTPAVQPAQTQPVQPVTTPQPQQQPNIFQKAKDFLSNAANTVEQGVKNAVKPPVQTQPTKQEPLTALPQQNNLQRSGVKLAPLDNAPAPNVKIPTAQKQFFTSFIHNPIDAIVSATQETLTNHPTTLKVLGDAQTTVERVLSANPTIAGFAKGASETYLNSSQKVNALYNTKLTEPVDVVGKTLYKAGEIPAQVLSFIAGGEILKGLGFTKAVLPILFATIGQTSASPKLNYVQRIEKIPVDAIAGFIFSVLPVSEAKNFKDLLSPTILKAGAAATATVSGQTFLNALIEGASPKEAARLIPQAAAVAGLFYMTAVGTGLIDEKILSSKPVQGTTATFTPDDLRSIVNESTYKDSSLGKYIIDLANKAEAQGKDVQLDYNGLKKSLLSQKLNIDKPVSLNIQPTFVERAPQIAGEQQQQPGSNNQPTDISPAGQPSETPSTAGGTVPEDLNNELNQNLAGTNAKISEALQQNDNAPVKDGYTRTYQVIENGKSTDQVFTTENALRQFIGHNDTSSSSINIKDIPNGELTKTPTEGILRIKSETPGGAVANRNDALKVFTQEAVKYQTPEDFAGSFGAKPTDQVGTLDANSITARDATDPKAVADYVKQIKAGKAIDPIILERGSNGQLQTFDGSNRLTAYQQAGVPAVVIYPGREKIDGLTTLKEVFTGTKGNVDTTSVSKLYAKDPEASQQALAETLAELEIAQAGQRIRIEDPNSSEPTIMGISSTFPDWIPEGLRSRKLIDKVLSGIVDLNNIKYPDANKPAQRALYDEILNQVDSKSGIDTAKERSAIMSSDNKEKTIESTKPSNSSPSGSSQPVTASNESSGQPGESASGKREVEAPKELPSIAESKVDNSSITLNAELIPGLSKTIEQDVVPGIKGKLAGIKAAYNEISSLVNPVSKAPVNATDILMFRKGEMERQQFRVERNMLAIKRMWDEQPLNARLDFLDKVETGTTFATKELNDLAQMYRKRLDNAYTAITQFKNIPFIENFFPRFWNKPDEVAKDFVPGIAGRRPLQGTKSFTKGRVFEYIKDGRKLGYSLVTNNPEELVQMYEQNVRKFVMAQSIKDDMTARGFWKFVRPGDKAPANFVKIDDSIVKVYYPQQIIDVKTGKEQTRVVQAGEYYAQKDVARLINNYLSKDFINDTVIGRGIMNIKNTMNSFEMAFSAFHITMESLDTIISKFAVGLGQIERGSFISGFRSLATSGFAPISYFRTGQKFFNGDKELLAIESDLFTGGASLKSNQYYKNSALDNFHRNLIDGNYFGALVRAPFAAMEGISRPIMSYYIPRLKVGAFRDLFSEELIRNSKRIQSGELTREKVARDTWNSIENRMGEINYDNLFWNRTFKSANMLAWRSVGWNLGTIREIGGAVIQELPRTAWGAVRGKGVNVSPKINYSFSLFLVAALIGGIYQYLHTGKKPESIKDLYYPMNGGTDANGDPSRVELPTYLKDIYQYSHNPLKTVGNKLAPELSTIIELLQNKDYYGNFIRNENDNLPTQAKQVALFLGTQLLPFSIQQVQQQQKGKATPEQQFESFLGILKAPKEVTMPEWEKLMNTLYQNQVGGFAPKTPEQQQIQKLKTQARLDLQNGKTDGLKELIRQGVITTPQGVRQFIADSKLTSRGRMFKSLSKTSKQQVIDAKKQQEGGQ